MSNEPGTAGKFAAKLAERQMEPLRKYFRQRNRASEVEPRDNVRRPDRPAQKHSPSQ